VCRKGTTWKTKIYIWWIILMWITRKHIMKVWTGLIWLRIVTNVMLL